MLDAGARPNRSAYVAGKFAVVIDVAPAVVDDSNGEAAGKIDQRIVGRNAARKRKRTEKFELV